MGGATREPEASVWLVVHAVGDLAGGHARGRPGEEGPHEDVLQREHPRQEPWHAVEGAALHGQGALLSRDASVQGIGHPGEPVPQDGDRVQVVVVPAHLLVPLLHGQIGGWPPPASLRRWWQGAVQGQRHRPRHVELGRGCTYR